MLLTLRSISVGKMGLVNMAGGSSSRSRSAERVGAAIGLATILAHIPGLVPGIIPETAVLTGALAALVSATTLLFITPTSTKNERITIVDSKRRSNRIELILLDTVLYILASFFVIIRPIMNMTMGALMSSTLSVVWHTVIFSLFYRRGVLSVIGLLVFSLVVSFTKLFTAVLQTYFLARFTIDLAQNRI